MKLIKYNKLRTYFFGALLSSLSLVSCTEENIIELEPYNQLSENLAFDTKENILLSVNGMYQAAQVGLYNNGGTSQSGRGYPFGAAYFQQNDMRGEDMVNTA